MPGPSRRDVLLRVAKALAVSLHAVRDQADPDLVWEVLDRQQRERYERAAEAAVIEYLAAVAEPI